ncbi:hypothetical protein RhiirA1_465343 [Rhizophagus irregularis]|uniref:Uncharacterized protein n=1 Tax=Rhizophagus irregularis TaxID=588596 RepID=A0A2N0RG81_9GLOM|nr:hypothetical protein RhiirA1_465343 [Rhizophagus irregularis]CAB4493005.1 unnamed protein product [Rhizophagus irregularis]
MRKAFAFLTSSLSSINKYSKEAKTSTQTTSPNIQKENNKSQIITSNIKDDKNENLIKKNNNDVNPLNKRKKNISNDLKKPTLKKSPQEIKKLESTRKTSSRTDSSTIVTTLKHSSSNRRKKLSVIKKSDDGDGESENASDSNIDNEEEDNDDDNVPLGLRFHHSRSISSNYPPPNNQEYYDNDTQIRNVSGMSLHRNRSTTKDPNKEKYHYHSPRNLTSPMPTTPPLIHTSRELYQPRPRHFRERKFSSSASSSSSASVDSNGSRYYRKYNANITPNNSQRYKRYSAYSLPYRNEYEYDDYNIYEYYYDEMNDGYGENRMINIPNDDLSNTPPIEKMRRVSLNSSSPRPRNDSFSRMYSGLTTTRRSNDSSTLVAGANPPPPNKYQKEATKRMSTSEYHKYQQEMVVAQYLKHGISPIIDDSTPVHSEPLSNNPRGPTLIQVQSMMMNISSSRPKCLSVIDRGYSGSNYSSSGSYTSPAELARKNSCTKTVSDCGIGACNGGVNSHRRTHSESNVQISSKFSTRQQQHHYHNTPLYLQHQSHHSSISSSSSSSTYVSSSGSGGPPTPTSRRSSIMFNSNVYGSRPSTPSSVGSGYIFEKEKRRKSVLRE